MTDWISVKKALPKIGEWVLTISDKRIHLKECVLADMYNTPIITIQPAQLRRVDDDGDGEWEQGIPYWEQLRTSAGHSMRTIDYVTMWKPLGVIPFAVLNSPEYHTEHKLKQTDVIHGLPTQQE